jgi:phosphonate transport system substrate-binding protein
MFAAQLSGWELIDLLEAKAMAGRNWRTAAIAIVLLVAATQAGAHPHGNHPIVIGVAPQQEPTKVFAMWQPMLRYLQREVGHEFAFETAASIEEFQKRVLEGRYDMWWGNPLTYIQASKKLGYVSIARDTTRIAGLLVTRKADGIASPKDLLGKKVAYSAPDAIGGTLLVQDYLIRAGVAPDQVTTVYTGSHDSAYRAVLDGHADAAGGVPRSFNALDPAQREKLTILGKTEEVAPQPFAVHPRVFRGVITKIQRALIKLNWVPEGKEILSSIQYKEIVVSNDIDYDIHRDVATRLKIPF